MRPTFSHVEPNRGQTDAAVRFLLQGARRSVLLVDDGFIVRDTGPSEAGVVRARFAGAIGSGQFEAGRDLGGRTNYLGDGRTSKAIRGIPQYESVRQREVYSGVDVVWYGRDGRVEYDVVVAPGADPHAVRFDYERADRIEIDKLGDLVVRAGSAELRQQAPFAYQLDGAAVRPVPCRYEKRADRSVGFQLGDYDSTISLVIDPVLEVSGFLGAEADVGKGVAADAAGAVYIAGGTNAVLDNQSGGAFVAKIWPDRSGFEYVTYFPGAVWSHDFDIAVDSAGRAFVTGTTDGDGFPIVNAIQPTYNGGLDAFVLALTPNGDDLLFSTFLGGDDSELAHAIAVDANGNVYAAGTTASTRLFPVVNGFQSRLAGAADGYVTKFSASGETIEYSTYLGGASEEYILGLAVDASGRAFAVGGTRSPDFPTKNALASKRAGDVDAFVTSLDASGASLVYSTYLGGKMQDVARAVAVNAEGEVAVAGSTDSPDFPVQRPAQRRLNGGDNALQFDGFVSRLTPSGTSLTSSTFVGGELNEYCHGVTFDAHNGVMFCGSTRSIRFPLVDPLQATLKAERGEDAFVGRLDPSTAKFSFSTYLGGSDPTGFHGVDIAYDIALAPSGSLLVTGSASSVDFPVIHPFAKPDEASSYIGAWIAEISLGDARVDLTARIVPSVEHIYGEESVSFTATVTNAGPEAASDVGIEILAGNNVILDSISAGAGGEAMEGPQTRRGPLARCVWPGVTPAGATRSLTITLRPAGDFPNRTPLSPRTIVFSDAAEKDVDNNLATATCYVHTRLSTKLTWSPPPDAPASRLEPIGGLFGLEVSYGKEELEGPFQVPAAPREGLVGYRLYGSDLPYVQAVPSNLVQEFSPQDTQAYVDGGFEGRFFVMTAVYTNGESVKSNEVSAGLNFPVHVSSLSIDDDALRLVARDFPLPPLRFEMDGIKFVKNAKFKSKTYVYTQKGPLANGESIASYRQRRDGRDIYVTVRAPDESILTVRKNN